MALKSELPDGELHQTDTIQLSDDLLIFFPEDDVKQTLPNDKSKTTHVIDKKSSEPEDKKR